MRELLARNSALIFDSVKFMFYFASSAMLGRRGV